MPRLLVLRGLLAAAASGAAGLLGLEALWRARGFRPEINDSAELWCRERTRASRGGARALALVGSSRMQFGVDPRALAANLPGREVIQLAIKGVPALPVLKDLVDDPKFSGSVLCEVTPQHIFSSERLDLEHVSWLEFYESRPWLSPLEGELRLRAQQTTVQIQPTLELRTVAASMLAGGGLPQPPYLRMRADRFMAADYARVNAKRFQANLVARVKREAKTPSEAQLRELFQRLTVWRTKLEQRGGKLVFLRMISSGPVREAEDHLFPREHYWDRLLQETGVAGVHFEEVPGAAQLSCPDASHLDLHSASGFASSLGALLTQRRLA